MNVSTLVQSLNLRVYGGDAGLDKPLAGGYTSDLLSDVIGFADAGYIWITLQTHKNILAVASLKDLAAIVIVRGLAPDPDTLAQADAEGIPLLGTDCTAFEITGQIYRALAAADAGNHNPR
ncbi:MAG: serine kinase [Prevotellaceae bacterium]|jgi:predicted transcriptional regulator|nr:serine kinase [Prevotellaceae bacterium]